MKETTTRCFRGRLWSWLQYLRFTCIRAERSTYGFNYRGMAIEGLLAYQTLFYNLLLTADQYCSLVNLSCDWLAASSAPSAFWKSRRQPCFIERPAPFDKTSLLTRG